MREFLSRVGDYVRDTDKLLLLFCVAAGAYGCALVYSATYSFGTQQYFMTQIYSVIIGVVVYLAAAAFDPTAISRFAPLLFILNLGLIGSLYFFGVGSGNRSWIRFGSLGFQPGEVGKVIFIITFAKHLTYCREKGIRLYNAAALLFHVAVTAGFVMMFSRDDGMTLAFLFIALFMALAAGIPAVWIAALTTAAASSLPVIWTFLLDPYQKERILAIFEPLKYPETSYQAMQSVNAITSGGIYGKGYLQGSKTQYSLIPTKHTDSIIAVAGEELGFIGCAAIVLILAVIIARLIMTALRARDNACALISFGVAGMLIFQTVLNIGMNIGVLPVIGLTLPFFSYGGTSVVTMFAAAGIAAGVRRASRAAGRREKITRKE